MGKRCIVFLSKIFAWIFHTQYFLAYYWVQSSTRENVPANAVKGGKDSDGSDVYVGLALHAGDELPCKVVPRRRQAFVSHSGKEIQVTDYKVINSSDWERWLFMELCAVFILYVAN